MPNLRRFIELAVLVFCGVIAQNTVSLFAGNGALAQAQATQPLSADDVSWLFPPPTKPSDLTNLISMGDLIVHNPQDPTNGAPVWSDAAFQQFLGIADSPASQVAGTESKIGLPPEARSKNNWFIAGVRIDAGAPGLSPDIQNQFGQSPQIRLIVQPVTQKQDGTLVVNDIAAHLIFDFTLMPAASAANGCFPRSIPDLDAFRTIVSELVALRTDLSSGHFGGHQIVTSGVPLGVHPGLADPAIAGSVSQALQAFLERHLADRHLNAMAIVALPSGAAQPWIFLSMLKLPPGAVPFLPNGGFAPVHGPTLDGQQFAELFNRASAPIRVVPSPHTNNRSPITCINAALFQNPGPAPADRHGSSTADLFANPGPSAEATRDILDLVADPTRSHFFNTDCVSCHTDTRLAMTLLHTTTFVGLDPAVLPQNEWVIRNFGWSDAPRATATRRTAAETAAVVKDINAEFLPN